VGLSIATEALVNVVGAPSGLRNTVRSFLTSTLPVSASVKDLLQMAYRCETTTVRGTDQATWHADAFS